MKSFGNLDNDVTDVVEAEQAARKKYGLVSQVPQSAFQLVLRKQTSLLPQARTKKEQHLEFCQALTDVRERVPSRLVAAQARFMRDGAAFARGGAAPCLGARTPRGGHSCH